MSQATHWLIAKNAREMCGAWYEVAAKDDAFYKLHPNQRQFIRAHWPKFIEIAKRTMAGMLGGNYPDEMKAAIFEALKGHAALNPPRRQRIIDTLH